MGRPMLPGPRRGRLRTFLNVIGAFLTGRARTFEIAEHSMRPTLSDGDWVVAITRPRSLRPGDVVAFEHPERTGFVLVKRISSIGPDGVVVIGDDPGAGSVDSVSFGAVPIGTISARILLRYRPLPPRLIR